MARTALSWSAAGTATSTWALRGGAFILIIALTLYAVGTAVAPGPPSRAHVTAGAVLLGVALCALAATLTHGRESIDRGGADSAVVIALASFGVAGLILGGSSQSISGQDPTGVGVIGFLVAMSLIVATAFLTAGSAADPGEPPHRWKTVLHVALVIALLALCIPRLTVLWAAATTTTLAVAVLAAAASAAIGIVTLTRLNQSVRARGQQFIALQSRVEDLERRESAYRATRHDVSNSVASLVMASDLLYDSRDLTARQRSRLQGMVKDESVHLTELLSPNAFRAGRSQGSQSRHAAYVER